MQQKGENEIRFRIGIYELHLHKYLKTRISLYTIMHYKTFITYENFRDAMLILSDDIFIATNIVKMEYIVMLHKKRRITRVASHLGCSREYVLGEDGSALLTSL